MRIIRRSFSLFSLLLSFTLIASSTLPAFAQCGVERWSVKTGTDADAGLVNLASFTPTTIANLASLPAPNPIPPNNRVQPTETTVWVINATLTEYKLESDSDYHLVISDGAGHTMICEIPRPSCVGAGSPFASGISNARAEFDAQFTVTTSFQTANIPVQIKGVGMFDFLHGQTGVAPNGIELHPVLDVIFNPSTNADFSLAASPPSLSVTQGSAGSSTISSTISGSFNSAVSLSASGLPSGATASFNPTSIAAPGSGSSTLTVTAGASTPTGTSTITVTGTGGGKTHTTSLTLTVTASGGGVTTLTNGQTVANLSGATGSWRYFKITVPSGQTSLAINMSGGTGDADLYIKLGAQPTLSSYDYRPYLSGNNESVNVTNPAAGDWYIGIEGYAAYAGVSLQATYAGGGGGGSQLLANPGFESGAVSWTASSGVITNNTSEAAHSGSWKAWLDGYGSTHTDTLSQNVTIAASVTTATLSFWLHVDTAETTTTTKYDTLTVQVRNSSGSTVLATLATYSNLNANSGYQQVTFNLSSFKGQTIQIYLVGSEDSTLQTSFVVDDCQLNVQ